MCPVFQQGSNCINWDILSLKKTTYFHSLKLDHYCKVSSYCSALMHWVCVVEFLNMFDFCSFSADERDDKLKNPCAPSSPVFQVSHLRKPTHTQTHEHTHTHTHASMQSNTVMLMWCQCITPSDCVTHGQLLSFHPNFQLNVENVFPLTLGFGNGAFQGHSIFWNEIFIHWRGQS